MELEIIKNLPMPTNTKHNRPIIPFDKMEIGDAVTINLETYGGKSPYNAIKVRVHRERGAKDFITKKDGQTVTIWRTR